MNFDREWAMIEWRMRFTRSTEVDRSLARSAIERFRSLDLRLVGSLLGAGALFAGFIAAVVLVLFIFSVARESLSRIPLLIWVFSCFIVLLAGILMKLMIAERDTAMNAYASFLALVRPLPARADRSSGLKLENVLDIRKRSQLLNGPPKDWWRLVDQSLERYPGSDGQEGWFSVRPIREILDEDNLVGSIYHSSFYQAIPGILTALGLLATFIAILQGLSGVTYNPLDSVHPVSGIDALINGLSGKFLTSIVALIVSIIFTFVEKKLCERNLLLAHSRLVARFEDAIPYLSQSRILLDMQGVLLQRLATGPAVEATSAFGTSWRG
jgi:hypothetical protein